MPELDWLTGSGPAWLIAWLSALEWQQIAKWITLAILGFVTGVFGVLVGAGGGFILVPILLIFTDMPPEMVAGTVLALVAVNGVSGAFAYRYRRTVDKRSAYLFAAAAIPGSVLAPFVLKESTRRAARHIRHAVRRAAGRAGAADVYAAVPFAATVAHRHRAQTAA